jgi:hypothetical protein
MAQQAQMHGPEKVRDQISYGRLRIDHRNINVPGRRPYTVRTDQIDFHFCRSAAEIAQNRHRKVCRKTGRHLHPQRTCTGRAVVA